MKNSLRGYVCKWEKDLNIPLMEKSNDAPLIEYIMDAWKSLEVVQQIKVKKFEYTEEESEIDINKHIFKREKKKKKKDRFDIKYTADDRVGKLTVHLEITMLEKNPETHETKYQVYPIKKSMLIPLQDENGFYVIHGKKYYLIYQVVEKSTYTSNSSVTLKSLMPICVKRHAIEGEDMDGHIHTLPYYTVYVFRKEIPVLLFYLAHGINYAMSYLNVDNVIEFLDEMPSEKDPEYIYFGISSKCFMKVDRDLFNEHQYIQSVVGGFLNICTTRMTVPGLDNTDEWIKKIANPPSYDKGKSVLKYFNRLMDLTTQKILKVPDYYKDDIYAVLLWMMEHFNELRLKDNCDLGNKRIRCNEYIASLLSKEFSKRLNRIISMGDRATIESMRELVSSSITT